LGDKIKQNYMSGPVAGISAMITACATVFPLEMLSGRTACEFLGVDGRYYNGSRGNMM
jgi:hypothetical protein